MIDQDDLVEEARLQTSKFLLAPDDTDHSVDPETQARLEALLEAAGMKNFTNCIVNALFIYSSLLLVFFFFYSLLLTTVNLLCSFIKIMIGVMSVFLKSQRFLLFNIYCYLTS